MTRSLHKSPSRSAAGHSQPGSRRQNGAPSELIRKLKEALNALREEIAQLPEDRLPKSRQEKIARHWERFDSLLEQIEEVQRDRLELDLLSQTALTLANALDLREVLDRIADSLKQIVDYDAAGIFLIRADQRTVEAEWMRGYEHCDPALVRQKLDVGLMGWAIQHHAPVVVSDVAQDPRYYNARPQTRSELVVPMFSAGNIIGCFNLESDRVGSYTERDAEHLAAFASHAAVAIERARMHREILQKQLLDEELILARRMQQDLLPKQAPKFDHFDITGVNIPSEAVGGDYFDYIPLTQKDLGIVIGDVSGKGVPAAFVMASLRAALRIEAFSHYAISTILSRVNDYLAESTDSNIFVTAFYGVLDTETGMLTYANAGHNPPLLLRADGNRELLSEGGMLLGAFPNALYHEYRVSFKTNDLLVLYTDGATEAENASGEQFGVERLETAIRKSSAQGPRAVIQELLKAIQEHTGKTERQDDITLIVIQCR